MKIELTEKEYRHLLDVVYVGNWVLNSMRGSDRFAEYDQLESKLFALSPQAGMDVLVDIIDGEPHPSAKYEQGGIHEAIADYEDAIFFEILAEELARRDMDFEPINPDNWSELTNRIEEYIAEFEQNGIDNISLNK